MKNRFILVADTSHPLPQILKQELATEYALLHAKDGQEAIDYLDILRTEIGLAIIDLELPVVSGLDVIWRLARQRPSKSTRIIATTAIEVPLLKDVVKDLGVEMLIQTPIPVQEWHRLINSVLIGELAGATKVRNVSAGILA
jgi:DNA-binding NarL/FixJ family response regulator